MDRHITIKPGRAKTLQGVLDDEGQTMPWTPETLSAATRQVSSGDSYEIRVDRQLAAIGGFILDPYPDLGEVAQAWMFAGPALHNPATLRASLDAINAVLDVAVERHGRVVNLVRADQPKAQRFARLLGFALPTNLDGGEPWLLGLRVDREAIRKVAA